MTPSQSEFKRVRKQIQENLLQSQLICGHNKLAKFLLVNLVIQPVMIIYKII